MKYFLGIFLNFDTVWGDQTTVVCGPDSCYTSIKNHIGKPNVTIEGAPPLANHPSPVKGRLKYDPNHVWVHLTELHCSILGYPWMPHQMPLLHSVAQRNAKIFHLMCHQLPIWCAIRCKAILEHNGRGCGWAVPALCPKTSPEKPTNFWYGSQAVRQTESSTFPEVVITNLQPSFKNFQELQASEKNPKSTTKVQNRFSCLDFQMFRTFPESRSFSELFRKYAQDFFLKLRGFSSKRLKEINKKEKGQTNFHICCKFVLLRSVYISE